MHRSSPDRVVIINDRSSAVGGASNLAVLLASELEAAGTRTTFFAGDHPTDRPPARDTINLCSDVLTQQSKTAAFASGLYNPVAFERLAQLIADRDTPRTIYHVHGWSKILSPSIFRALQKVRSRTLLHAHDYFLACPNGGFANFQKAEVCDLSPMSARCLMTQCDKRGRHQKIWRAGRHMLREQFFPIRKAASNIITIHEGMRSFFDRAGIAPEHIHTVRNPVEPFIEISARPWLQRDFFFIGRLEPEKGFEEAARAATRAGVRLHMIGDGIGLPTIRKDYPNIVLHGWKSKVQMRSLLASARAIVIASRVPEPFGLVAIEAIASGIPVILPDSALLANEIVAKDCGLSYRSGDVSSLASAMRKMARDDDGVQWMSINGFLAAGAMAETPSSWARAISAIYQDVLERAEGAARSRGRRPAKTRVATASGSQLGVGSTPFSVGLTD